LYARNRKLLAGVAGAALMAFPAAASATSGSTSLAGKWVSSGAAGKIVLTLHKAGSVWKGTYVQGGKTYKATAEGGNADGAGQITLTLIPGNRSTMCGLQGAKLFCSTATGMATFSHA
jgi:hypothetical protein